MDHGKRGEVLLPKHHRRHLPTTRLQYVWQPYMRQVL